VARHIFFSQVRLSRINSNKLLMSGCNISCTCKFSFSMILVVIVMMVINGGGGLNTTNSFEV
jgi:hypothetical protein